MRVPPLHLLHDSWIPVRRRSGARDLIRPADVVAGFDDPVVDIDWPRADFRAAALEFLIGLLTTAAPPASNAAWKAWWRVPPSPEELAARFAPFAAAFVLDGDGPRFLQDGSDLGDEIVPIGGLLIEQPGANTEKNNTDLFQKRGRVEVLARSTAAIALYTLQTFAPSGGAGHRTGLRGGGPLTTLPLPPIDPSDPVEPPLWRLLWLATQGALPNAEREPPFAEAPERTFPWLAPLRISDKTGVATVAKDIHPAQCFWGQPRRIALVFEPNPDRIPCDLTGRIEDVIVRGYRTRPYGVNYGGIEHPLSPWYRVKAGAEWLPVHPQPGGLAWRFWPGFVLSREGTGGRESRPATCIGLARDRLHDLGVGRARLRLLGYDMDNMKARAFVEAERPLFVVGADDGDTVAKDFADLVATLVASAVEVVSVLNGAIRLARGRDGGSGVDLVTETLWATTEDAFWAMLDEGQPKIRAGEDLSALLRDRWLFAVLRPVALATFDREVPAEAMAASAELDGLERAVAARRKLTLALAGHGAEGKRLFEGLGLAVPVAKTPKARKSLEKGAA